MIECWSFDVFVRLEFSVFRSLSLMGNFSRYEDCMDEEIKDLFVVVDDLEKYISIFEVYVIFRIIIKVCNIKIKLFFV